MEFFFIGMIENIEISKLKSGDVIFTTCHNIPLCYHLGIVIFEDGLPIVYNNTPNKKNKFGGNIVAEPLNEFFKNRKFIKIDSIGICPNYVREYSYQNRLEKWNALYFNCEDYVNDIIHCQRKSKLRNTWQLSLLVGIGVIIYS